jgi:DNA-binding transcriptional LysR family regulator
LSQPAVSNALARLRETMDDPLFMFSKSGGELTAKARRMITPVREALALIRGQLGGSGLDLANTKRMFRILMLDPLEPIVIPPVLRAIQTSAPGISIESVQIRLDALSELRSGKLDLAFHVFPPNAPDIASVPVVGADPVVVSRRNHPAIRKRLDLKTFSSLGHAVLIPELQAMTQITADMAKLGIERRCVYMVYRISAMAPVVAQTDLLAMLPRWFAHDVARRYDLDIHPSPIVHSNPHIHLLWRTDSSHDPGLIWLRDTMLNAMREHLAGLAKVVPLSQRARGGRRDSSTRPQAGRRPA